MARRTKEEALATRNGILDAAERTFQRQGVSRTTLHDIAQAAGVTRGAVYWHFKDKADLFSAMMDRVCLPLEDAGLTALSGDDADALVNLRAHLVDVFGLVATDERARRVFEIATQKVEYVDELSVVRERHLDARREHVAQIEQFLRAAQREGLIGGDASVHGIALGLHAIVDGMIQTWLLDPAAFDLARTGALVIDVYLNGLPLRLSEPA